MGGRGERGRVGRQEFYTGKQKQGMPHSAFLLPPCSASPVKDTAQMSCCRGTYCTSEEFCPAFFPLCQAVQAHAHTCMCQGVQAQAWNAAMPSGYTAGTEWSTLGTRQAAQMTPILSSQRAVKGGSVFHIRAGLSQ